MEENNTGQSSEALLPEEEKKEEKKKEKKSKKPREKKEEKPSAELIDEGSDDDDEDEEDIKPEEQIIKKEGLINQFKVTACVKKCSEILEGMDSEEARSIANEERIMFSIDLVCEGNNYKWDIYRTAVDIKKNFGTLENELEKKKKFDTQTQEVKDMFMAVKNFSLTDIRDEKDFIAKSYSDMLNNVDISSIPEWSEFFEISNLSLDQLSGIKPKEGWGYKKVDPQCARR
ncbi:MAG: hypothetical protein MJ252_02615 [archaeon]|nr:hypothetical protein [archaeon]